MARVLWGAEDLRGAPRGFGRARHWERHRPSLLGQCRPGPTMGSGFPTPRGARVADCPVRGCRTPRQTHPRGGGFEDTGRGYHLRIFAFCPYFGLQGGGVSPLGSFGEGRALFCFSPDA